MEEPSRAIGLRKSWPGYLGNFNFAGKTVLEFGPASGFLGLKMEQAGAKVTAFEIPEGSTPDLIPIPGIDMAEVRKRQVEIISLFRKNWRYYHSLFGSKNEVIYGDIYDLSKIDRRFQVATFSAILLHLANPFCAIQEAAKITDETIIVTDVQHPALKDQPYLEFNPHPKSTDGAGWWLLSHGAVSRMLSTVGFHKQALSFSTHRLFDNPTSEKFTDMQFFTIIASRGGFSQAETSNATHVNIFARLIAVLAKFDRFARNRLKRIPLVRNLVGCASRVIRAEPTCSQR